MCPPALRSFLMRLQFSVSDSVSATGRSPFRIRGLGYSLHKGVLDLVGESVEVQVLDPPVGFRGIVNNVSESVEYVADRGSTATYVMVEFRGQRITSTPIATGDSGAGLGLLGITTVGIGQSPVIEEEVVTNV